MNLRIRIAKRKSIQFLQASPEQAFRPAAIAALPDEKRRAVLRQLEDWLLVQHEVLAGGTVVVRRAGFMGYGDLSPQK